MNTHKSIKALRVIPGVGPSLARDLYDLGMHSVEDLKGADPAQLYADLCELRGEHVDRCVLYVFREAVYYAEGGREPEMLRWWNWKDK